ncbi:PAS domain-containing protein [Photorhabdus viridis]|uniref:PAS domain-containing protein n=1 Tax=Photorhabdus viridis TaxID=3163327 RepID=UPI003306DCBE
MSNKKTNQPNNIDPQLIHLWESSHEPWGVKALQSKFIYANPAFYQLLNLPEDFCKENNLDRYVPEKFVTIGSSRL